MLSKKLTHIRRKERTRYKLKSCNVDRLRLCFYTSNKYIYSQIIDEQKKLTITSLATYCSDFKDFKNKNNIKAAEALGEKFAIMLLDKNITDVYFDRGKLKYHGKAKAFADSARKNGLNF